MKEPWSGGHFTHDNMIDEDWRTIPDGGLTATSWSCEWWSGDRAVTVRYYLAVDGDTTPEGWDAYGVHLVDGVVRFVPFDPADTIASHRMWLWLHGVE